MPPLARVIGLGLLWTWPGWLPAQSVSPGRADYAAPATARSEAGQPWPTPVDAQPRTWQAPGPEGVVPADFQAPLPAATGPLPASSEPWRDGQPQAAGRATPPSGNGQGGPIPLASPNRTVPLKLTPPGKSSGRESARGLSGTGSLVTVGSSLAVVLGLFVVSAWVLRRTTPAGVALLPGEVVEVLGRAALANRQQIHLLRCGNKLLLVCASPGGVETLTEITDPDEVTRLAGLCQQSRPGSTTGAFRHVFEQLAGERAHDA